MEPPPPYDGKGRPRVKGAALPKPRQATAEARRLRRRSVAWYGGGTRRVGLLSRTGHWYKSGAGLMPIRWVFVRDRDGRHRDELFFNTDPTLDPVRVIETSTARWKLELSADLPTVWQATTTTPAERQGRARILIEWIAVTVDKASERVGVEIHWFGGLVEVHTLSRPVKRYDLQSDYPRLVERLRDWGAKGLSAAAMAQRLNAEGFRPLKRAGRFTGDMVRRLLWHLDLTRCQPHGSLAGLDRGEYRPASLARKLSISRDTVRRRLRAGWLTAWRDDEGHYVIWAAASELRRLEELHCLPRNWATRSRLAELTKLTPRPGR